MDDVASLIGSEQAIGSSDSFWDRLRKIDRRTIIVLVDQMIVSGTSLLSTVVVGRYCVQETLGMFALAVSVVVLVRSIHEMLVSAPYVVFRARANNEEASRIHAGCSAVSSTGFGLIAMCLVLIASILVWLNTYPSTLIMLIACLAVSLPFCLARDFARRFDMARMNMASACWLDLAVCATQLVGLFVLAINNCLSAHAAIAVIALANGLYLAPWWMRRSQMFQYPRREFLPTLSRDWRFSRWLLVDQIVCFLQVYAMHWILTFVIDTKATGIFAACAAIASLASPFFQGVGNYIAPRFAEVVASGSHRATSRLYWKTTTVMFVLVSVFALIATLFGGWLLEVLYDDPALAPFHWVVAILAVRFVVTIPYFAAHHAIVAMEKPRVSASATFLGLVISLGLAVPFILRWGIHGACWAWMAGTIVECVTMLVCFSRLMRQWNHEVVA